MKNLKKSYNFQVIPHKTVILPIKFKLIKYMKMHLDLIYIIFNKINEYQSDYDN